jgi:putative transposase
MRTDTMVDVTMDPVGWLRKRLEAASPDLLREMLQAVVEAVMGAEADLRCGAPHGARNHRRYHDACRG